MNVNQKNQTTIWLDDSQDQICVIDQRYLPHEFVIRGLKNLSDVQTAISEMWVRGAPLIGITAVFGLYLNALKEEATFPSMIKAGEILKATRPTAINLAGAIDQTISEMIKYPEDGLTYRLLEKAIQMREYDIFICKSIGKYGLNLLSNIYEKKKFLYLDHPEKQIVNILTHCNAGWLGCVDYGTATSPIYLAHDSGIPVHVWVDETRPRNQGANLTAWELNQHGVPHTVIVDNTGGHLMQHGMVDICIVGTDRTTYTGDVANKIGTYLKALAAHDNQIPFYVALPETSIDWEMRDGIKEIPIEERSPDEVHYIYGKNTTQSNNPNTQNELDRVRVTPIGSAAKNYGFDVTPARLITGLITERGVCSANESGILSLYPEKINLVKKIASN